MEKKLRESEFELMHPDDMTKTQEQFFNVVSTKTPRNVEYRYKHSEGRWVHVESSGTPVLNEKGEVSTIVIVGRDITERKKTEEHIRKSEKLSLVGQLASSIAHEIRNPLTTIKGFSQLLQKYEKKEPLYIDTIISEIRRIEYILTEFIAFAKHYHYQFAEKDIHVLLIQVLNLFNTQTIMKNIMMIQECGSDLPNVHCDENQLKQVFIHILQNAVEAMPNGGIIKIQLSVYDSNYIKIKFIDNGVGMTEQRLKSIGEPFYCLKEKGTGFGLMACNKIIREHGGTINITSMINQGTTVEVILPINQKLSNSRNIDRYIKAKSSKGEDAKLQGLKL